MTRGLNFVGCHGNLMIIDTHCHLYFDEFDQDRPEVIERAVAAGVNYMVNVGIDPVSNEAAHTLAARYDFIFSTAGFHPHHAHEVPSEEIQGIRNFVKAKKPVAIGEIGLDYFKSQADAALQKKIFSEMLKVAMENNLPVIVHSRNAFQDTLEILKSEGRGRLRGVMHCFSYDEASLKKLLDIGFLASFTCNLTFKSASSLLEVAKFAPLDRIMLETDSPYLAPQSHRGQRNEPAYLSDLAGFLSEKRGVKRAVLEETTSRTAMEFFGIGKNHE